MSTIPQRTCFIVAANPEYRFGDTATIRPDLGAFVYELSDVAIADDLLELYRRDVGEPAFALTAVEASEVSAPELVLARREIRRAISIGQNLSSDDYRSSDATFRAIGACAVKLEELESELRHELSAAESETDRPTPNPFSTRVGTLPEVPAPRSRKEAIERLLHIVERHRLLFLFFAGAIRINPGQLGGRTGIRERVLHEDVRGYDAFMKSVDPDGNFLFQHRDFLDRYADEAVTQFGPGEGWKPKGDGATHPYWSIDDVGASYIEESADSIFEAVARLQEFDSSEEMQQLADQCLGIARDRNNPRWYSCVIVRWIYLYELDQTIAEIKRKLVRCSVGSVSSPTKPTAEQSEAVDNTLFYLSVFVEEGVYNHDPILNGECPEDPTFLPISSNRDYFFAAEGNELADRLIALFNHDVKPKVETGGESITRVTFAATPAHERNDHERFLIDEDIEEAQEVVARQHHSWRVKQGLRIVDGKIVAGHEWASKRPPLASNLILVSTLHDQAQRWVERLEAVRRRRGADNAESTTGGANADGEEEKTSPEMLRVLLPTAITATIAIRDLQRIRRSYPDVIPVEEAEAMQESLFADLTAALENSHLRPLLSEPHFPASDDPEADMKLSGVMAVLALNHPNFTADPSSEAEMAAALEATCSEAQRKAVGSVGTITTRLIHAMLYDCRTPNPAADGRFKEPGRFLQMFGKYWGFLRSIVMDATNSMLSMRPHPLTPMIMNFHERIKTCLNEMSERCDTKEVQETIATLVDIVLSSEPDELQMAEEWTLGRVGLVDQFIEKTRLNWGAKTYPLTYPEELSLSQANRALAEHRGRIKKVTARWLSQPQLPSASNEDKTQSPVVASAEKTTKDEAATTVFTFREHPEEPVAHTVARLTPAEVLRICEQWQDEAIQRVAGNKVLGDSTWGEYCEILAVLAEQRGYPSGPIVGFQSACGSHGIPATDDLAAHSRPAVDLVTAVEHWANSRLNAGAGDDDLDLSVTQLVILKAVFDLGATCRSKKVTCPRIAKKTGMSDDSRLRTELSHLRQLKLLGGPKRTSGYWLTEEGIAVVDGRASEVVRS
ncbi:MAG: hypothetical protein DCC68_07560 [Planctomycetota bacterium]|nr:MAG: hypothetical protein DCC68_07560 [Planctomycetota bacterium]